MVREVGFSRDKYGYCENNQMSVWEEFKIV